MTAPESTSNTDTDAITSSLMALAAGDQPAAIEALDPPWLDEPLSPLRQALHTHLTRSPEEARGAPVYDAPAAFEAFIDGGDNPALYAATIRTVQELHENVRPKRVLDIGCGDGRVTSSVLGTVTEHVDLVEPSAELLAIAEQEVGTLCPMVHPHQLDAQAFLAEDSKASEEEWNLVQSTFAMHSLPREDRIEVMRALRERTEHLLLVEFDVPAFTDHSSQHARYAAERYQLGLAEYADQPLVVEGFLMPVLVGQFDPSTNRVTHEQPISEWVGELTEAGFASVQQEAIHEYWWANAHLLHARAS